MAFGFGFNKQKVLSAAEKFVQQGKVQNAIAEYEKILKADPKDLTVMNTVGDLYSRLGDSDKAVECFKSVGDAYAAQGFTVKAIAMYKKLSKSKPSLESVIRLAELYTQQGLFNDARAQYLQVAEEFLKAGELEQAVRIFQKTLEMDPENVAMRTRLAEVYVRLGKKTEAWQIFAAAAESLRGKGQLDAADGILQRMVTLDPTNSYVLLLRGRTALDSGDVAHAIEYLEKVSDLDSNADGLRSLFQAYLQAGRLAEAGTLAGKLIAVHNDTGSIHTYVDALVSSGHFQESLQVYEQYSDRLLSSDPGRVLESLHTIIGHVKENTGALETLLDLFHKAGENTHLTEVYELLAHAYVQSGDLEKARDYYLKLTQLEPQNQLHSDNYQQVLAKLGGTTASRLITAEEGAVLVDELEATAPFIDQRYDDQVALAVRAALTDAELFISYNMPAKALAPLLMALPQAPGDLRLNQRLAALHTRAARFAEAAVCTRTLESIYHDAGHPDEASRYGELASKYEERAAGAATETSDALVAPAVAEIASHNIADIPEISVSVEEPVMSASGPVAETAQVSPTPSIPVVKPAPAKAAASGLFFHAPAAQAQAPSPNALEFEVQAAPVPEAEIDLSSEWEGSFAEEDVPATPAPVEVASASAHIPEPSPDNSQAITETIDEIRFYLGQSMHEEAVAGLDKLRQLKPEEGLLNAIRSEVEGATAHASAVQPEAIEEISAADLTPADVSPVELSIPAALEAEVEPEPQPEFNVEAQPVAAAHSAQPEVTKLDHFVHDLESSLGEEFSPAPAAQEVSPEVVAATTGNFGVPERPEPQAWPQPVPPAEVPVQSEHTALGDFVSDLEASLGDGFLPQVAVPPSQAEQPKVGQASATSLPATTKVAVAANIPAAMAAAAPSSSSYSANFAHSPTLPQAPTNRGSEVRSCCWSRFSRYVRRIET